jgi:AraC-like DNA-binding protein
MRYLTSVRMALAAGLLDDPATTVAAAARAAGYRDPYAFAAAFKRARGTTPSGHRGAAR